MSTVLEIMGSKKTRVVKIKAEAAELAERQADEKNISLGDYVTICVLERVQRIDETKDG